MSKYKSKFIFHTFDLMEKENEQNINGVYIERNLLNEQIKKKFNEKKI